MASVIAEHVTLIPLMLLTIVVFPVVANTVVHSYAYQQRLVLTQGAVNQLASSIQQLYYSLNQDEIMPCKVLKTNPLPTTVDSYPYYVTGDVDGNELNITLSLQDSDIRVSKTIVLGLNIQWGGGTLSGLSPDAAIEVQKFTNNTILFSFK